MRRDGYISPSDFEEAIARLHQLFEQLPGTSWETCIVKYYEHSGLRIKRHIPATPTPISDAASGNGCEHIPDLDDSDEERIDDRRKDVHGSDPMTAMVFDVIHSPIYGLPVLYLSPSSACASLKQFTQGKDSFAEHGFVSVVDHPWFGRPVRFVHPCQTAEAMRCFVTTRELSALGYLVTWIGLVGGALGFHVPVELAVAMQADPSGTL